MTSRSVKAAEAAVVRAKCIGCGAVRDIDPGEIPEGDHPCCSQCGMPMIAMSARLAALREKGKRK